MFMTASVTGGAEYHFRKPVTSTATITEANGVLEIRCRFQPTRAFSKQTNKKVDRIHAKKIANQAILMHFGQGGGNVSYRGMTSPRPAAYQDANNCVFYFSVPRRNGKNVGGTVAARPGTPTAAAKTAVPQADRPTVSRPQAPAVEAPAQAPVVGTRPSAPVPAPQSIITAAELKKMTLAGHAVRVKQDTLAIVEDFERTFDELKVDCDLDGLKRLVALNREVEAGCRECREKLSGDTRLMGSEMSDILGVIQRFEPDFKKRLTGFCISRCDSFIAEVKKEISSREKALSTAAADEKAELKADIRSCEEALSELNEVRKAIISR